MTRPIHIVGGVAALAAAGLLVHGAAKRTYFTPRAELEKERAEMGDRLDRARRATDDAMRVEESLRSYETRTLGSSEQEVDHRFRTRLNRLAEGVGLERAVVTTSAVAARPSPARTAFPRRGAWRTLRNEIDFHELEGAISGEGTLETVVRLVDRIDAEPWLKRIDQVRLDPKDNGVRFGVSIRLTTLYRNGRDPGEPAPFEYDDVRLTRFADLVAGNPFRIPAPEEAAPAPTPAEDAGPPPFPWHEWMLTGIAGGPDGPEAWLHNQSRGETRRLLAGGVIGEATLERIVAEWAEFHLGDQRFRVRVGEKLSDRSIVNKSGE